MAGARLGGLLGKAGKFVPLGRLRGIGRPALNGGARSGSDCGKSLGGGSAQLCSQRLHLTVRPDAPIAAGSTT